MEKQILAVVFKRNSYECICDDKQKTKKKQFSIQPQYLFVTVLQQKFTEFLCKNIGVLLITKG